MTESIFSPVNLAALILLLGLVLYTLFGGADFGSGIWMALVHGPRAHLQRESLFHAIGPIWETNHVWLIFVVVTLFTAFPIGFSALFIALLVPFVIALVGISFRGAAFAFRHFGERAPTRLPATGLVFSISSILTPFAMGMAVTATAAGRIQWADGQVLVDMWGTWITPFTLVGGLVGLAACAFLTPIYMSVRTEGVMQEDFRRYGLMGALALGILTAIEIPVAFMDAPLFAARMLEPLPLLIVLVAVLFGCAALFLLWTRRYFLAQFAAGGTITATLLGFGSAMYPDLLIDQLTFFEAAAPAATLSAYLLVLPFGALILIPSLWLLYRTFLTEEVVPTEE